MKDRILAIAELTFRKLKDPAFFLLFVFAACASYAMSEMEALSIQKDNIILSELISSGSGSAPLTSFLFITCMTLLLGIFAGATDIPRDIDSRMIMILVGKPIRRTEYLIGKYLGVCLICITFFIVAAISANVGHFIKSGNIYPITMIIRQFLLVFAVFPFVAMTVMFSCFFNDITAMIMSSVYLIFSLFLSVIPLLVEMLPKSISITTYLYFIYYTVPNFLFYFLTYKVVGLVSLALVVYSLSITVIFLMIASLRMNARDMLA
jgi:ABC-type transport system involved in multi-copper enzyme maturation permease subunit